MASENRARSGVALIIVLGLVAILLIVSVAFTITMRVERAGAANLRHAAVARQIVKGGMAAAIVAIDNNVNIEAAPRWFDENDIEAPFYKGPTGTLWKSTFVSYADEGEHLPANIFTPVVESYFPSGSAFKGYATFYFPPGVTSTGGAQPIHPPEWIPVNAGGNDNKDVIGRYAFFALDTTGLLDASCVNRTNRWMGRDPAEITLSGALFPRELNDAEALSTNMKDDGRYDSFAEFAALNEAGNNPPIQNTRSFTTFSYEPQPKNGLVYIGGNTEDLTEREVPCPKLGGRKIKNKWAIIDAFYHSGLIANSKKFTRPTGCPSGLEASEQACWAYLGLVDYVDADNEMFVDEEIDIQPWERPVTEALPVMSGFIAKFTVEAVQEIEQVTDAAGKTYYSPKDTCRMRMGADFKVPFVYPFLGNIPQVEIKARAAVGLSSPNDESKILNLVNNLNVKLSDKGERNGTLASQKRCYVCFDEDSSAIMTDWEKAFDLEDGEPPKFDKDNGYEFLFQVAGATYVDGKVQHRWPLAEEDYNDNGAKDFWMTVRFNTAKESFKFGGYEEVQAEMEDGGAALNEAGKSFNVKKWTASAVVWADFLDPRFACKEMLEGVNARYKQLTYYMASHIPEGSNNKRYAVYIPITKLTSENMTKDFFKDFQMADFSIDDYDKDSEFGHYFDASYESTVLHGTSPLISYVLSRPGVAGGLFHMNMDGVLNESDAGDAGADTARVQWRAYVRNGPLDSVGELGYLPIGIWHTIRLYDYGDNPVDFSTPSGGNHLQVLTRFNHLPGDDDATKPRYHTVLDYFTVTEELPQGRVNLNSMSANALAAVFHAMPIATENAASPIRSSTGHSRYRIDSDGKILSRTDSLDLFAQALLDYRADPESGGQFKALSDLGKIFLYPRDNPVGPKMFHVDEKRMGFAARGVRNAAEEDDGKYGEFERESVIRNSCGLFTTRGQTFIIAVRGESFSPLFGKEVMKGGTVNASKTAVGQVWRDSVPSNYDEVEQYLAEHPGVDKDDYRREKCIYPKFVQFFKIIDD